MCLVETQTSVASGVAPFIHCTFATDCCDDIQAIQFFFFFFTLSKCQLSLFSAAFRDEFQGWSFATVKLITLL